MRRITDCSSTRVAAAAALGGGGAGRPAEPADARRRNGRRPAAAAVLALAAAAFALAAAELPEAHANAGTASECSRTIPDATNPTTISSIQFASHGGTPVPNGTYTLGDTIDIRVTVTMNGFEPTSSGSNPHNPRHILGHSLVKLETGETDRFAKYIPGSFEDHHAHYRYTVEPGDSSDDLDYHSEKALYWAISHAGSQLTWEVADGNSTPLTCILPPPMGPGSLSNQSDIKVDGIVPRIVSVATPSGTGVYSASPGINVTLSFDDEVLINGTGGIPLIALDAGANARNATYVSGNGSKTLSFWYAAQGSTAGLDYVGNKALALNGSTIRDENGNPADLTIRDPGADGRFGDSGVARILDTSMPFVRFVSSPDPGGTYGTGRIVNITAVLDRPVTLYGGEPRLELNTVPARHAAYAGGNGTGEMYFLYAVMPGDSAARLDYASAGALSLPEGGYASYGDGGGTVTGLQPLLPPGAPGSLGGSDPIAVVGGTLPILRPNGSAVHNIGYDMLKRASDVDAFEMGGDAYALVAARGTTQPGDHGIQLIRIDPNGTLSAVDSATPGGGFFLLQPTDVAVFELDGMQRALVSTSDTHRIQLVDILPSGTLVANGSAVHGDASPGGTFDRLERAAGAAVVPGTGGGSAAGDGVLARAIVASRGAAVTGAGAGIQLVGILQNGTLSRNGSASDGGVFSLSNAGAVDVLGAGGDGALPRAIVAAHGDNAIQLVSIHPDGTILANGSATNGTTTGFDMLATPAGVTAFRMDGLDYAVVSSFRGDGIQLVRIHPNGDLDAAGSAADGTRGFDALDGASDAAVFEMGGWMYALVASYYSDGIQLARIHPDGALAAAGSGRDKEDGGEFDHLDNAEGVAVFDAGNHTYALVAAEGDDAVQMVRLSPASVAGASSPAGAGPHPAGTAINITVAFDERVVLEDPLYPPSLLLSLDGTTRAVPYLAGNGTTGLVFNYTVRPGDATPSGSYLEYAHAGALVSRGAITDMRGDPVDLGLPRPGANGSLSQRGIAIDAVQPYAVSVSSPNASGTYAQGDDIHVTVQFSEAVNVIGTPMLELVLDGATRSINYSSGTGSSELTFLYTVQAGDETADLTYAGTGALSLDNGGISDTAGNAAIGLLPDPAGRSLPQDGSGPIRIDGVGPRVTNVTEADPRGAPYGAGKTVRIAVALGERAEVSDGFNSSLRLALDGAETANARYDKLSDDGLTLFFTYEVQPGDAADPLDYDGTGALSVTSGTITDVPGNPVVLALPDADEGAPTLAAAGIRIETGQPYVVSVSSTDADGTYGVRSEINITVSFNEDVHVAGSPQIELGTGGIDPRAAYSSGSGSAALEFVYTVLPGDASDDLDYAGIDALSLNGGTIQDAAGNPADLDLPDPGLRTSLGGSSDIIIDTTISQRPDEPASVLLVSSTGGTYGAGTTVDIAVIYSRNVSVTGTPMLALSTTPARNASYVDDTDGDPSLLFRYTVQPGDSAARLDYAGRDALSLNGGTIQDAAGRPADLELPRSGEVGLLYNWGVVISAVADPGTGGPVDPGPVDPGTGGTPDPVDPGPVDPGTGNTPTVVVGPGGVADGGGNLTSVGNDANVTIDLMGLARAGAGGPVSFPADRAVVVATSFASVSFPPGVVATPVPADGRLALYVTDRNPPDEQVQERLSYDGSGTVVLRRVVEIGDEDATMTFSLPVRISLEGQAGGRAFYIDAGTGGPIMPIDKACAADDTGRVHRQLNGSGECQVVPDGASGSKVVYTYHLSRFGTAGPALGAPPPVIHECSLLLGMDMLPLRVSPGASSDPVLQNLTNAGSLSFERVVLDPTPWYIDPAVAEPGPDHPSLPASISEVSLDGRNGEYRALGGGSGTAMTEAAQGLGAGQVADIWYKINLSAYAEAPGRELVQRVTYLAECGPQ